ncbi:MAG: hypothetical protein ABR924_18640 [Terracidiphilus sp.]|jgi:hypothetical protein
MEERFIVVTIAADGRKMDVEAENFHGEGCMALLESFDVMGPVLSETTKPEYNEANQNFRHAPQSC